MFCQRVQRLLQICFGDLFSSHLQCSLLHERLWLKYFALQQCRCYTGPSCNLRRWVWTCSEHPWTIFWSFRCLDRWSNMFWERGWKLIIHKSDENNKKSQLNLVYSTFTQLSWVQQNLFQLIWTYAMKLPFFVDHSSFIFPGQRKSQASVWSRTNHFELASSHSDCFSGFTNFCISSSITRHIESVSKQALNKRL